MGRHSAQGDAFGIEIDLSQAPAPGSRRALRLAAREQAAQEAYAVAAAEAPIPLAPETVVASEALVAEELESAGASDKKPGRFSLFSRSRAAVVTVVVAASGMGFAGAMSLAPSQADAQTLQTKTSGELTLTSARSAAPTATAMSATFTVSVDGTSREVTTTKATLYEALLEAGIIVDGDDKVSQVMNAPVIDGSTVTITRVEKKTVTEEVTDAHGSSEVEDDTLAKGTTKVETEGVDGVTANTYEITYEDGVETVRTLTISSVKIARVDEVVKVGTAEESTAAAASGVPSTAGAAAVPAGTSQEIAYSMIGEYGWGDDQFSCLVSLWNKESGWNYLAQNRSSGAYGIPQALPGSKMASAGADWATNPATQIRWGLGYISGRYGTPCGAWAHSQSVGWY